MHFSTGPSRHSWKPAMVSNAKDPSYWLNWRFMLCAVWVLSSLAVASILMSKYEGLRTDGTEGGEAKHGQMGTLYEDEAWRPCLRTIHPVRLLVFRVIAFFVFVALLAVTIVIDGVSILFFYTQWTFMLVTIYFGLGLLLPAYVCYQYINKVSGDRIERMRVWWISLPHNLSDECRNALNKCSLHPCWSSISANQSGGPIHFLTCHQLMRGNAAISVHFYEVNPGTPPHQQPLEKL